MGFCAAQGGELLAAIMGKASALACVVLASLRAAAADASPEAGQRIVVAASIAPLAHFVREVGGDRVEVRVLVPPASNPHVFEPKPSHLRWLARAHLLVLNGAGLEYWAPKLVAAVANPKLTVIETARGMSLLDEGTHGANPHLWLDVRAAMTQVERIRDALVAIDPGGELFYRENAARFLRRLEELDSEIAAETAAWPQRQFIALHSAWVYFARRYGLEQVAAIERAPGREPTPVELAAIVTLARKIGARAIFAEIQLSPKAAEALAREAGLEVLMLDPHGFTVAGQDYVAMMRYNVAQLRRGLGPRGPE